jgi:hypothetical protein
MAQCLRVFSKSAKKTAERNAISASFLRHEDVLVRKEAYYLCAGHVSDCHTAEFDCITVLLNWVSHLGLERGTCTDDLKPQPERAVANSKV